MLAARHRICEHSYRITPIRIEDLGDIFIRAFKDHFAREVGILAVANLRIGRSVVVGIDVDIILGNTEVCRTLLEDKVDSALARGRSKDFVINRRSKLLGIRIKR